MAFAPDLVFNDGYYDLIEVTIPDGCVLRPRFPAPLGQPPEPDGAPVRRRRRRSSPRLWSSSRSPAVTGRVPNFVYSGTDEHGNDYQILEILYGGIPARPFADGLDGHSWWPLFKAVPTEYLEKYYPLRVQRYESEDRLRWRRLSPWRSWRRQDLRVPRRWGLISYQDDRAQTFPVGAAAVARHGSPSEQDAASGWLRRHREVQLPVQGGERARALRGDRLEFRTAGAGGLRRSTHARARARRHRRQAQGW